MNILVDYHHSDLLESLHRLFEDRLGMSVYVPHGLGWFEEGYWQFGHKHFGDALARQFLLGGQFDELQPHRKLKQITVEEAREMDFAVVMATVQDNQEGYHRFAQEKGARYAVQVGNVNQGMDWRLDPVILDATGQFSGGIPFTPEFDIEGAFSYRKPLDIRTVFSFVNLFPGLPCYPLFEETKALLPNWTTGVFGHSGPDGFQKPTSLIGSLMGSSAFGWQDKVTGDGFGYVIHYWASVGRPIIGHGSHYRGQVAADLWEDGVTCIDLDIHSPAEAARLMNEIVLDPARHEAMSQSIASRVRARVNFEADAQRVAEALGLLVPA